MDYYTEVESYVKKNEVSKKYYDIALNNEDLINKLHIGRLIVGAQGGIKRAKYGNELIKKGAPLGHQLTRTNLKYIMSIKEEAKRNFGVYKK